MIRPSRRQACAAASPLTGSHWKRLVVSYDLEGFEKGTHREQ